MSRPPEILARLLGRADGAQASVNKIRAKAPVAAAQRRIGPALGAFFWMPPIFLAGAPALGRF